MSKYIYIYFAVLICFVFSITLFFHSNTSNGENINFSNGIYYIISNEFSWPLPGYTTITSTFGYRNSPTAGASTYHSGVDIAAPTGSNIIASFAGKVIYTGFYNAGGFTVMVESSNYTALYCHVSPSFLVNVGDTVKKGQIIAHVGPKNVYNVPNNPYKDSSGNPTNGATTGPHLHFGIRKDGSAVNPLDYISSSSSSS